MFKLCNEKERGAQYIIRAALREEMSNGWVWLDGFQSRTVIRIKNLKTGRSVICQARELDDNFIKHYNLSSNRHNINMDDSTIVMSGWYRDALGIPGTKEADNRTGRVTLTVCCYEWIWGQLRAACHHPDIVVRLGTRLGVLGAWLGLLGVALSLVQTDGCFKWLFLGIVVVSAPFLFWCCMGPSRPKTTCNGD